MLRIAICDDNPKELSTLSALTYEYIQQKGIAADIIEFAHPDVLLSNSEKDRFHLYILDIVMPMVDGISLGKELRRFDREAQIIYATTEADFALRSFVSNPINFLVKPVDNKAFFQTLELAFAKIPKEDAVITIKTKDGIHTISQYEILCCEYVERSVKYTLLGSEVLQSLSAGQSFSVQISQLLTSNDFIQPHISFAVNLRHVEKLSREGFVLREGVVVPVSKKQYTAVRDAYLDYRLKREVR